MSVYDNILLGSYLAEDGAEGFDAQASGHLLPGVRKGEPLQTMVLISDGNSEHVAHA